MNREEKIEVLLILIQAVSVVTLWSTNSTSRVGQDVFALFLSVDLVAFAMMAQVYRVSKSGAGLSRAWVVVSGLFMVAMLLSALFVS